VSDLCLLRIAEMVVFVQRRKVINEFSQIRVESKVVGFGNFPQFSEIM